MRGKWETTKAGAFAEKHRNNPKAIAKYLNAALSTGDPALTTKAIGEMVRAQGVTRFSQKAGVRRDSLYRSFSGEMSPAFEKVIQVLQALDVQLIVKPAAGLSRLG